MWQAHTMAELRSLLRHPLAFVREKWVSHAPGEMDAFDDDELSDGQDQLTDDEPDPEKLALVELLHEDASVRGIAFDFTAPNEVEVFLEPWSEASAQRVRDVCAPRIARLVAGLPPGLDELGEEG